MGPTVCLYACSDGWWSDMKCDSVTCASLGSVDSEGFILGEGVSRRALGKRLFSVQRVMSV